MRSIPTYRTIVIDKGDDNILKYLFESTGEKNIIKVIEYSFIREVSGIKIYNLGFGHYHNGLLVDDSNSNNGDMRKIFNTVLSTVPKFFREINDAAIFVQGSDSISNFQQKCQPTCKKNCVDYCKNYNRRIRTYCYYVNKYFTKLNEEYMFFGYVSNENSIFVNYLPGNEYLGILVVKKKMS